MLVHPLTIHPLLHIAEHLRPRDREECLAMRRDEDLVAWANDVIDMRGNHFIFSTDDGEPVAAAGWTDTGLDHVVRSWLVATEAIQAIGLQLHQFAVRGHRSLERDGVRRFMTTCLQGGPDSTAKRWMWRLGYRLEGIHRDAGVLGQTLITMARRI